MQKSTDHSETLRTRLPVVVGFVPAIHVFTSLVEGAVQDVDARHKGEHDELEIGGREQAQPRS
jgi:hypothetical protein